MTFSFLQKRIFWRTLEFENHRIPLTFIIQKKKKKMFTEEWKSGKWLILGWTIPLKTRNSMNNLIEKLEVHTLRAVACWHFPWDYCNTMVEYLWLYCTIVYFSLPVSLYNGPPVERLCTACIKTMRCRLAWNLLCFKILVQFSESLDLGYPE